MIPKFVRSISKIGLFVGILFFCAALTPSLLPRNPYVQGNLAGAAFMTGYFVGWAAVVFWRFLELPLMTKRPAYVASVALTIASLLGGTFTLGRMASWQNSIRELMDMPPVDSGFPFSVIGVALLTAMLVFLLSRAIIWLGAVISRVANRLFPRRISYVIGALIVVAILFSLVNGFILRVALRSMDDIFAAINQAIDEDIDLPAWMALNPQTQSKWEDIGRHGQRFLTNGPDQAEIAAFTGKEATDPVRVYVGYEMAETPKERAEIALSEMIARGGFERSVIVAATPTGTGWLDPSAIQPIAYLLHGDLAIVATQYSYLPSWLTLLIDPDRSRREARALFNAIHGHWAKMDPDTRPDLYLFGLSLGALGSEASSELLALLSNPIDGAFWAGPPFASTIWKQVVRSRNEGSAQWQPVYQNSEHIRFQTKNGFAVPAGTPWDTLRIVYLQHPSDPMIFFSPSLSFSAPAWLGSDRGPDVSPKFRWLPIVTFLQVAFDIPMATSVPAGYGHTYTPASYIDGWLAVMGPRNWTKNDTERLKQKFADFNATPM